MGLFKKKPGLPSETNISCPAEGCKFVARDRVDLERHVNWKHPGIKQNK